MRKIAIGQKVRFDPFRGVPVCGPSVGRQKVIGTVIYVNDDHQWFEVEYELSDVKLRIAFKYCDIGDSVKLCK